MSVKIDLSKWEKFDDFPPRDAIVSSFIMHIADYYKGDIKLMHCLLDGSKDRWDCTLSGELFEDLFGNGSTPEEAVLNLINQIREESKVHQSTFSEAIESLEASLI